MINKNVSGFAVIIIFGLFCCWALVLALFAPQPGPRLIGACTKTVQDMAGHNVPVPDKIQSVMIFPPIISHYLTVANSDAHVAAIAPYLKAEAKASLQHIIFPGLLTKKDAHVSLGALPLGAEQVLLMRPDVVFSWSWMSADLQNAAYSGLVQIRMFDEPDEMRKLYDLLAVLEAQETRTARLFEQYEFCMRELLASVPLKNTKASVIIINAETFFMWDASFQHFNATLTKLNAFNLGASIKRANANINVEALLKLDPDFIFLNDFNNALSVATVYDNPFFKGLTAVKNRRVYRMPRGLARMSGPVERPLLFTWLAQIINPEYEPLIALREQIRQSYAISFNRVLSDDEIDYILHTDQNSVSYGYYKFLR